jgi:hypothetical protein
MTPPRRNVRRVVRSGRRQSIFHSPCASSPGCISRDSTVAYQQALARLSTRREFLVAELPHSVVTGLHRERPRDLMSLDG